MGGGSYISIVRVAIFFAAVWLASKASQRLGISTIVAEILVGVTLGPAIGGLMPREYAECQYDLIFDCDQFKHGGWRNLSVEDAVGGVRQSCLEADMIEKHGSQEKCFIQECEKDRLQECSVAPDIFTLVGHIGVSLMIFEAGMHVDFEKVRLVGAKSCCVAVLGTGLPIILGMLLIGAIGYDLYPDGLAVGISLAPTSIGISLKLLGELGVLDRYFGQAIIVAAVVDDILALIAYSLFFALAASSGSVVTSTILLACGVILMGICAFLAVRCWPRWMEKILQLCEDDTSGIFHNLDGEARRDTLHALIMWAEFLAYATAFHFLGSHLWGCFIGGLSFTAVPRSHHIWVGQTKLFTTWMLRVFFACTVGFAMPVKKLLTLDSFLKGMLIGAIPCLGAKVFCAPFMGDARWVIGWGMCGRAEFAYLIAQMALSTMLMSKDVFSICIWSLLWATLIAPLVFQRVLNRYKKKVDIRRQTTAACGMSYSPACAISVTKVVDIPMNIEDAVEFENRDAEKDIIEGTVPTLPSMMPDVTEDEEEATSPWIGSGSKRTGSKVRASSRSGSDRMGSKECSGRTECAVSVTKVADISKNIEGTVELEKRDAEKDTASKVRASSRSRSDRMRSKESLS